MINQTNLINEPYQVEDHVEHVLQLEALPRRPLVEDGVDPHAHQQKTQQPGGWCEAERLRSTYFHIHRLRESLRSQNNAFLFQLIHSSSVCITLRSW